MSILLSQLTLSTLFFSLLFPGVCPGQTTELGNVDSFGAQGSASSFTGSISADGRHVAFQSIADNFVPGDTNGYADIFVHDRQTGLTALVSVDSFGTQGNSFSTDPAISGDGRYVAFESAASNLVPGDTNGQRDVFVRDLLNGTTERVSVDSFGAQANKTSYCLSISADGHRVGFQSRADNLVFGDTNGRNDAFVHDRQSDVTVRVSVNSLGAQGNGFSSGSWLSGDGRCVTFWSEATNLVAGDINGSGDIFVHDLQTGATELVSIDSLGRQGNATAYSATLSADGRYVAFDSAASDLVPGDTNGDVDCFVHDRQTGATTCVSVNSLGKQGQSDSRHPFISAGGRYVVFRSSASNLLPGDANGFGQTFVHDIQTGVTECASVNSLGSHRWAEGHSAFNPEISGDGRYVAFGSGASNLVPGDTNGFDDIFVRDRWNGLGINSIYLIGPLTSPVLTPLEFSWQTAHANSQYSLAFSSNVNGAVIRGHRFDIGIPVTVVATGINAANGLGAFTSPPVPLSFSGQTLFFEVSALDPAGVLYDSNVLPVTFF